MDYDEARLREVVERAVPDEATVLYAVVAGSHLHGVAGPDSDVDLRAVHVVDAERYASLDPPAPRVVVNQDGVSEGFEDVPDVEIVSFELRTFGGLVADGNFNALEALFADDPLVATPEAMDPLRETVSAALPLDAPRGYLGMARDNFERFPDPEGDTEQPTAKQFLRVLRALLAAKYVTAEARIESEAGTLADYGLDDPGVVDDLVDVRRSEGDARPAPALAARAREAIEKLFDEIDPSVGVGGGDWVDTSDGHDDAAFRDGVDEWLLDVRRGTPGGSQ